MCKAEQWLEHGTLPNPTWGKQTPSNMKNRQREPTSSQGGQAAQQRGSRAFLVAPQLHNQRLLLLEKHVPRKVFFFMLSQWVREDTISKRAAKKIFHPGLHKATGFTVPHASKRLLLGFGLFCLLLWEGRETYRQRRVLVASSRKPKNPGLIAMPRSTVEQSTSQRKARAIQSREVAPIWTWTWATCSILSSLSRTWTR